MLYFKLMAYIGDKVQTLWGVDKPNVVSVLAIIFVGVSTTACLPDSHQKNSVKLDATAKAANCSVEIIVLGTSQDAGTPQIGNPTDPAWKDPELRGYATSIALIDYQAQARYLFEATPDIREQVQLLDKLAPMHTNQGRLGLAGIFLTHAHIGHYGGLIFLGHESASTKSLPLYAMPRMTQYLQTNGPWSQLVDFKNIDIIPLENQSPIDLGPNITVTPYQVPHRDEYSETVGFLLKTASKSLLFLPDIDNWDRWQDEYNVNIEEMIKSVDYAFIDATFYDDNELPGRDMSAIPHPSVVKSMDRFTRNIPKHRNKVHFIHVNHTNPIRYRDSSQSQKVESKGFNIARREDRHCL